MWVLRSRSRLFPLVFLAAFVTGCAGHAFWGVNQQEDGRWTLVLYEENQPIASFYSSLRLTSCEALRCVGGYVSATKQRPNYFPINFLKTSFWEWEVLPHDDQCPRMHSDMYFRSAAETMDATRALQQVASTTSEIRWYGHCQQKKLLSVREFRVWPEVERDSQGNVLQYAARPATTQYVSVPLCLRKDTDGLGMNNDEAVLSEVMTNCSRTSA